MRMERIQYFNYLKQLQTELCLFQEWVKENEKRIVVVFEGRDTAGKGGAIKVITEKTSRRIFSIVALGPPKNAEKEQLYKELFGADFPEQLTEEENERLFFARYIKHLPPKPGEVVIFDRSWYNRAGVDHVMNFDQRNAETLQQRRIAFFKECQSLEKRLENTGVSVIKFWLEVDTRQQKRRLEARIHDPRRHWKFSPVDAQSLIKRREYDEARDLVLENCNDPPWVCIDSTDKRFARLNCIAYLLSKFNYEYKDRVSDIIVKLLREKKMEPRQMPFLVQPPINEPSTLKFLHNHFFRAISPSYTYENYQGKALQLAALDAIIANELEAATVLIRTSIESYRYLGQSADFINREELSAERAAVYESAASIFKSEISPKPSFIIHADFGMLKELAKMGLLKQNEQGGFSPIREFMEQAESDPNVFAKAKYLALRK